MKKSILICTLASCLFGAKMNAQVTAVGNGTVVPYRFLGWDGTGPGLAKPLDIRNNWAGMPMNFFTSNVQRMTITPAGLVGIGNIFTPAALLHLNSNGNAIAGEVFRTQGPTNQVNAWRMYTGAGNGLEKFKITYTQNGGGQSADVSTIVNAPLHLGTVNQRRVTILGNQLILYNRIGFVGFNNQDPRFHIDINTQDPGGVRGELLLRARTVNDPNAYIGFVNISTIGNTFTPTLIARQSNNDVSALNTLGSIVAGQDLATNPLAVTRFFSAIDYDPSINPPNQNLNRLTVVNNRRIFEWHNGPDPLMTMSANGFLGISNRNPGNRLEINSDFYIPGTSNPYLPGTEPTNLTDNLFPGLGATNATGFSGLRFTDLTSNSNPRLTNPGQGVLALDANGDVIYVAAGTGGGIDNDSQTLTGSIVGNNLTLGISNGNTIYLNLPSGGPTIHAQNGLTEVSSNTIHEWGGNLLHNTTIDFNSNSITYNQLGTRRFQQYNNGSTFSDVNEIEDQNGSEAAHYENVVFQNSPNWNYGRMTHVGACDNSVSTASAQLIALGAWNYYSSIDGVTNGVFAKSRNLGTGANIAGEFRAEGAGPGQNNYGISAYAPNIPLSYAGSFSGKVRIAGNLEVVGGSDISSYSVTATAIWANGVHLGSDQNIKTNITPLSNVMAIIDNLNPKSFYFDTLNTHGLQLSNKKQYGFVAQDIEQFLPELVEETTKPVVYDSLGQVLYPSYTYKSVNYNAFFGILAQGMKEQQSQIEAKDSVISQQQTQIEDLNTRLSRLESCLSSLLPSLCEMNQQAIQQTPQETQRQLNERLQITLSDRNTLVLQQNVPNPFAEKTVIEYSIPTTVQKAQLHFYNAEGKLINSVDLNERGNGELTVFANDLSSGIYTYSLVADGKVVATKKMMKN